MGRGASPMRSMVRSSPKKPSQENMDSHHVNFGELTPMRKPLSSILESSRNPLVASDDNGGYSSVSKGKLDATTPKMKKRGGQCLLTENIDGGNATPEKQGHGKVKKSRARHQSPAKSLSTANVLDVGSVEPGCDMPSSDDDQAVGTCCKGQLEQHGSFKLAAENTNSLTPRANNERGGKLGTESEPTSSARASSCQNISATPAKGVTRTLKFGAAHGPGVPGSSTSRALVPIPQSGRNAIQEAVEQQFNLEEDPTFWHDHNVQVLIRTRPISSSEVISQGFSKCLRQESPHTITWLGPPETRFTFDQVAGEIVSQEKLFNVAGLPMVENCMAGYNSCMFAYGQTGSGKTHTMLGDIDHLGDKPSDNRGMTPRVFEYLFSRIKLEEERRADENLKFLTKCSFLEIYNEQITDLLEPTSTNLQMREDVRKGVYVDNLTEVEVNSVQDVIQLLSQGSANRKVAATNMNRESSRSHSVFTCIIESKWERDSMTNIRFGRLNLVDLAGSERQKTSGAEGERLKEAANINKSLSTLGLVIMILVDVANGKQRHVPYRDSKLTFLLQDSLGGNSKTTIIATVSPSSCNSLETLSTLKFAQRAKLIRNTAVINEDASGDVKALRAQIQQMKEELDRLRRQSISRVPLSQDDFNPIRSSVESWGDAHKFFGSPEVFSRKFRQMESVVESLKAELAAKEKNHEPSRMKDLELENIKHLELIADLRLQLKQSEERAKMQECTLGLQLQAASIETQNLHSELEATKEAFEAARALAKKLQTHEAALVGSQYAAAVKQIRLETEEMAVQQSQSLTNIQEMAVLFRMKETELRGQLEDAQIIIQKLSAKDKEKKSGGVSAQLDSGNTPNSARAEDGSFGRLQRAQEIEMRHAEEVMQLQLELESLEAVLEEERVQKESAQATLNEEKSLRRKVEENVAKLTYQLQEAEDIISNLKAAAAVRETTYFDAVSKLQLCSPDLKSPRRSEQLDQDKSLMEALEIHHHHSTQEFEALQADHTKLLEKLERREEREKILRKKIDRLEHELTKEQEIRDLERECAKLDEGGLTEEAERLSLEKKLESAKQELEIVHTENLKLSDDEFEKDMARCQAECETVIAITSMQAELVDLRGEVESLCLELAAAREMVSERTNELDKTRVMLTDVKGENLLIVEKFESILMVKDREIDTLRREWQSATVKLIDYLAEGDKALNEASFEMEQIFSDYLPFSARSSRDSIISSKSTEKMKAVELKQQLQHAQVLTKDAEARVRLLNETAFALATAQALDAPQKLHRLSIQAAEAMEILHSEADSMKLKLLEFEKYAMVMSVFMHWLAQSGDAKSIAGSIGCENPNVSESSIAVYSLKEKLALTLSELKEAKDKAAETAAAHESLAIVKEVWEVEKKGLQSDLSSLERDKLYLEAEIDALRLELSGVQHRSDRSGAQETEAKFLLYSETSDLLKEKDERISSAKPMSERISSMSVPKEDRDVLEMRRKLESLQDEIRVKEKALVDVEKQLFESLQASVALGKEKDDAISDLTAELNEMSSRYAGSSEELGRVRGELDFIQAELGAKELLLQDSQTRVTQEDVVFDKLSKEKEAIEAELEAEGQLLQESLAHIAQVDIVMEKLTGEKEVLHSQLESMTLEANVASLRLCEAEEAHSCLQDKVAFIEARIAEYESKEQSLVMEIEELSTARNMSDEDVLQLQNEVLELRRERDSLNLEVSTMDMQSAISDKLQYIQSVCIETDDRIASMQLEIEALTSAKKTLESEVQSIEAMAAQLLLHTAEREESLEVSQMHFELEHMKSVDVTQAFFAQTVETQGSPKEILAVHVNLQAAEEKIACKSKVLDGLFNSKAEKEEEYRLLKDQLEHKAAKLFQAQEKLEELAVLVQEYSTAEESWRNEKDRLLTEVRILKSELEEKELHCLTVQEEKEALERPVQEVAGGNDAASATISSLKSRTEDIEASDRNTRTNLPSDADDNELAKVRAALTGAEEKVKLLVDANATMTDAWEGERSMLNADKELMQLEISRLEKPVLSVPGQCNATSRDAVIGKDHYIDELKQVMKRTSADCEKLRSILRERDNTILSVKLQLEEAMVHYKEAEIEMEKTIREKEDAISRIAELESEVSNAQDEIMRRRKQVESFELELDNVVVRVTDSEAQRRAQGVELECSMDIALAETCEEECKNEPKYESEAARAESDNYSVLEKKMHGSFFGSRRHASEEVDDSMSLCMPTLTAIALVKEEFDFMKNHIEKEIESLADNVKSLKADMSSWFSGIPVDCIQEDLNHIMKAHSMEIVSLTRKIQGLERLLAGRKFDVSTLHTTLLSVPEVERKSLAEEEVVGSVNYHQAADPASACADLENTRVELEMSEAAVSELLTAVGERDATLSSLESALKQSQARLAELSAEVDSNRQEVQSAKLALFNVDQLRALVDTLQRQVTQREELIKGLEYDINLLEESGAVDAENAAKTISQLQKDLDDKSSDVNMFRNRIATLEAVLDSKLNTLATMERDLVASNANAAEAAVENSNFHARVKALKSELAARDALVKESEFVIISLKSELENAKSFMAENEAVAIKARQSAEVFKSKSEEMMAEEEQLRNRVSALQNQVNILEKKIEEQIHMQELAEKKLTQVRHQGSTFPVLESKEAQAATQTLERKLNLMEADLSIEQQRHGSLQLLCEEKDRQIKDLNAQINQLTLCGKQTSESQQKVRLEAMVQSSPAKSLAKASSIGPSFEFRNADFAVRRRIEELEALAAERLKEVYTLNAKIADLESEMHDVVRELVRTNLDVQNFKLSNPQVKEIVATVRRRSVESQKSGIATDVEVEKLRNKLNEFIEERDSWLEEIQKQQVEMTAARVTAEQMRFRDDTLTAENEKLKTQSTALRKRICDLEQEMKKLSGQQNLQQRIHHHAKIKDENNSLRLEVEGLNTKLRRLEMMFARVKDELERYRISAGKSPFPNIDEEQRLRSKLQEAEERKIQFAQQFITLCNAIQRAAGSSKSVTRVDQSTAIEAIRNVESRLRSAEDEVSDFKLKARISGEKRRLSELRTFQSPMKSKPRNNISGALPNIGDDI